MKVESSGPSNKPVGYIISQLTFENFVGSMDKPVMQTLADETFNRDDNGKFKGKEELARMVRFILYT